MTHRFLIIADGQFGPLTSKTANSCIRYFPERMPSYLSLGARSLAQSLAVIRVSFI